MEKTTEKTTKKILKPKKPATNRKKELTSSIQTRLAVPTSIDSTYLSTSVPLLDYYLSDTYPGGFKMGKIANIIGDSSSGKSLLVLTMLAEAANNPQFEDYELIYDDAEVALEFDIEKMFGKNLMHRMRKPKSPKKGDGGQSESVEELYQNLLSWLEKPKPIIYIVDSLDSIKTKEDDVRACAFRDKGAADGSYSMGKPKLMSEMLRVLTNKVAKNNSFVGIVSQVRDKIGVTFGPKKTRTGGRALEFYCSYVLWLNHIKELTAPIKGLNVSIGNETQIKIKKNKGTGKRRDAIIDIYYDYGIDGMRPALDFLIATDAISTVTGRTFKFGNITGTRQFLLQKIEDRGNLRQQFLQQIADTCKGIDDLIRNQIPTLKKYE